MDIIKELKENNIGILEENKQSWLVIGFVDDETLILQSWSIDFPQRFKVLKEFHTNSKVYFIKSKFKVTDSIYNICPGSGNDIPDEENIKKKIKVKVKDLTAI